jgi:hypothetical protein
MWDGRESLLSSISYHPGINGNSVVLIFARPFETKKGIRVKYTGGLAADAVRSVYAMTQTGGPFVVGKFIHGETSETIGIVKAQTSVSLTIEVLYGTFTLGETVTQWETESGPGTAPPTATLDTATSLALAESYPEIVRGVELQLRYMWKNKDRFEQQQITKDGSSTRRLRQGYYDEAQMQPEVASMLAPWRRLAI